MSWRLADQLCPRLAAQNQVEALQHIEKAMRELATALEIRAVEDEAARQEEAIAAGQ